MDKQTKNVLTAILDLENKSFKVWQDEMVENCLMSIFMRKGEEYNAFRNWVVKRESQKKVTQYLIDQLNIQTNPKKKESVLEEVKVQQEEREEM